MKATLKDHAADVWHVEDDLRTLARAEEIKRDPKRLAAAKECAQKKAEALQAVTGVTSVTK